MAASFSPTPATLPQTGPFGRHRGEARRATIFTVVGVIATLNAIGLLIVLRRFAGALNEDLPRDAMLLAAVVAAAALASTRLAWRHYFPLDPGAPGQAVPRYGWPGRVDADLLVGYGSSAALVLLAVGCCYPANHTSDWLIWLPLLVADQFWRQSFFDAGDPGKQPGVVPGQLASRPRNAAAIAPTATPARAVAGESAAVESPLPVPDGSEDEQIVQQLFRVRDPQGREEIYGAVRADFQPGQRTATVYVGFCPPLSHHPEILAESIPASAARIKVVQAFGHGTRMDVRLAAPAEASCHVWIDMAATPAAVGDEIGA